MKWGGMALAALLLAAACSTQQAAQPGTKSRASAPTAIGPPRPLHFKVTSTATGLEAPWSVAFLPNGDVLISERPGRVRLVQSGQLQPQPALTLDVVQAPGDESGLLGIALHPGFPNPPDVYLYYTYGRTGATTNRVSRFHYADGRLSGERTVLDGIPGDRCCHYGGRIAFGPDGLLYITTGEGQDPARAADRASLGGKLLRVADDGSVPPGNPYPGSPVYAWGLRNPQGLTWDRAGHLYVSSNGPTGEFELCCHDEIDLIQPGGFYGWPVMAGTAEAGQPQDYGNPPSRVPPLAESGSDTWAPSGMAAYSPDPKREQQTLLVATLRGKALRRFIVDATQPDKLAGQEVVLAGYGRLRDVVAGPDGCAYVLTSNRDGRGSPQAGDDQLLKACPS